MSPVAIATSSSVQDPDTTTLLDALARHGLEAEMVPWDAPVAWDAYDLVVIRSTWDYVGRREAFLAWARSIRNLANPYRAIEYSSDKHYLADLAARGHRVVETHFCDVGTEPRFFDGDVVVKPAVGAGSGGAARYRADERDAATRHVASLHRDGFDALIQPYVSSVDARGERAVVVIDGEATHAMTKAAMLNVDESVRTAEFRRAQMSRADLEPEVRDYVRDLLADERFADLLYARVDLVETDAGWALMELELVEPNLFLSYDAGATDRLAAAIARRD